MTLAAVGVSGIATTWRGWVPPKRFAEVLFAVFLLFGVWVVVAQPSALWAEVLGTAVSAAMFALSVKVRSTRFVYGRGTP